MGRYIDDTKEAICSQMGPNPADWELELCYPTERFDWLPDPEDLLLLFAVFMTFWIIIKWIYMKTKQRLK